MTVTIEGQTPGITVDGEGAVVNVTVTTGNGGGGGGTTMPSGTAGQVPQLDTDGESYVLRTPNTPESLVRLNESGTIPDVLIPGTIARDSEVTAAVDAAVTALLDGAPSALDTLNELAAALGDDASFAATVSTSLAAKLSAVDAADQYLRVVVYDFDADEYPARPDAAVVRWIGPTEPTAWVDWDEWREVVAPPTEPGAPTDVVAVAGNTEVDLTWTGPVDNGGSALTGYRITPYIGATPQTPIDVGVVTSYTVTGLTNGTAYTFTVAAENSVGIGAASTASNEVTPTVPPVSIVREQSKTAGDTTNGANWSLTFDTAPTEGNLLVAYINTSTQNVTFSNSNGWTQASVASYGSSSQGRVAIWYKVAGAGESSTVTFTFGITAGRAGFAIEEWSGITDTSPLDDADSVGGVSSTTLTIPNVGPTSQADTLAVACVGATVDLTLSAWTGGYDAEAASTLPRLLIANQIVEASGSTIGTAPSWSPSTFAAGVQAVFKGA